MLSPQISELIAKIKEPRVQNTPVDKNEFYVKVNELAKKAGMFYEKIRYLIDYKEEHTIRRNAIQRILKRNLLFKTEKDIAKILIHELIRGGYLESGVFQESGISYVQGIIDKFLSLQNFLDYRAMKDQSINKKIIGLASSEIEIYLFGDKIEEAVLTAFCETAKKKINISQIPITEEEEDSQIYIACLRSFLKADEQTVYFRLLLRFLPNWTNVRNDSEVQEIAKIFPSILSKINKNIDDSLNWKIARKLKNQAVYFSLIKEIIDRYGAESEQILDNPTSLEKQTKHILEIKYKKENERIRKSAFRAIIYILFTKTILAFILEMPYDLAVSDKIYYPALMTNVLFHPFLLFLITYTIKPMGDKNTNLIISGLKMIIYDEETPSIQIRGRKNKNFLYLIFLIMYGFMFLMSFGAVVFVLNRINFNIMSIILFTFFLTLVSYFGLRIRYVSKNWAVGSDKERTLHLLGNILIMPIVEVGRWLSQKFEGVNVLVFVMDFIIETPFKVALSVFDSFISFLKEKKEEMY